MKIKSPISKRNIKTALAVCLGVLVSAWLKLEYPFFTVIAIVFTMENAFTTYKSGLFRLIGTVIGAFVGLLCFWIQPGNAFLMGLGTLLIILVCNIFKWDRAIPIAGVMFAAIMLSLNNKNPLYYSMSRVLDTFIGIVIAVGITYLIFPPRIKKAIDKSVNEATEKLTESAIAFIGSGKPIDFEELKDELRTLFKTLEIYISDYNPRGNEKDAYARLSVRLNLLSDMLSHLHTLEELKDACRVEPDIVKSYSFIPLTQAEPQPVLSSEKQQVFNYHLEKLLHLLEKIKPDTAEKSA